MNILRMPNALNDAINLAVLREAIKQSAQNVAAQVKADKRG